MTPPKFTEFTGGRRIGLYATSKFRRAARCIHHNSTIAIPPGREWTRKITIIIITLHCTWNVIYTFKKSILVYIYCILKTKLPTCTIISKHSSLFGYRTHKVSNWSPPFFTAEKLRNKFEPSHEKKTGIILLTAKKIYIRTPRKKWRHTIPPRILW